MFDDNSQQTASGDGVAVTDPATVTPVAGAAAGFDPGTMMPASPIVEPTTIDPTTMQDPSPIDPQAPIGQPSEPAMADTPSLPDLSAPIEPSAPPVASAEPEVLSVPQTDPSESSQTVGQADPAQTPTEDTNPAPSTMPPVDSDQLVGIKQAALGHLEPLVEHLDQSPEDQFKTIIDMIRTTDNHTMLAKAFDLAKKISDDKVRANALLDVINEINYFTQLDQSA
jgi:hypothetical protein